MWCGLGGTGGGAAAIAQYAELVGMTPENTEKSR
jgi:hypothetical protein